MYNPRQSAATRFIQIYMIIAVLTSLATFLYIYYATIPKIEQEAAIEVRQDLRAIERGYKDEGIDGAIRQVKVFLADQKHGAAYLLLHSGGELRIGDIAMWPADVDTNERWRIVSMQTSSDQKPILMGVGSVHLPGDYQALVARDMEARTIFRKTATQAVLGALAVTLVLVLGGGYLLSRFLLKRVEHIALTAEKIMYTDLSERIRLSDDQDEFDQLALSLNMMLARIEDLVKSTRTVADGIAHDFRSPLTRLKTQMEVTLRQPRSEDDLRETVSAALEEIDGIIKTLNALLEIVRAENNVNQEQMKNVDLAAIIKNMGDLYQPLAEDKGLSLAIDIHPPLKTHGHPALIAQAISNLVDNAVKYSPPGGEIRLSAAAGPTGPYIVVADSGAGIPADNRHDVLERFVRLDSARSIPGAGLGLSLVAAVAKQHNAKLALEDNHPGLRVILNFKANPKLKRIGIV